MLAGAGGGSTQGFGGGVVVAESVGLAVEVDDHGAVQEAVEHVYYEQVATHWGNWAKVFFNNKGVVAKATDVCMNYPKGDVSVWDWPVTP